MIKTTFTLIILLFSANLFAADITWLKIYPQFHYKDITTSCSNSSGRELYLSAEVNEGSVLAAQLHRNPSWPYTSKLAFSKDEIAGIEMFADEAGRWWVEKLPLSRRIVSWILLKSGMDYCPSQALKTVNPAVVLEFELEGVKEGILVSHSGTAFFKGIREDGNSYESELRFTQRIYKNRSR